MNKEILRLAIPNIISNISIPLLSTVDTMLMGRLSAAHLGAVGIGSMIFNFIYWNFGFLRMGTTGMTAQAYGREDDRDIMNILGRACLLGLLLAAIIFIFQSPLLQMSIYLMNVVEGQHTMVADYFYIRMYAAPATLMLYALTGWYFGLQNAIVPLILTIVANVVNILLSAYLVRVAGLGIIGVAWGTVVAQYLAVLVALAILFFKYSNYLKYFMLQSIVKWNELKTFLHINQDLFIRTVGLTFAFGFFYSQSSKEGEIILAVNVVLLQFVNWMSYGIDGFAFASESIVGKYYGRGEDKKLIVAIKLCFVWALVFSISYACIYWIWGDALLYIFTDKIEIIETAKKYLIWMIVFPILAFPSYIWDGIFIGFTASKSMRNSMFISLVFYLGIFYLLLPYNNHGLWISLMTLMVVRGITQTVMFVRGGKNII